MKFQSISSGLTLSIYQMYLLKPPEVEQDQQQTVWLQLSLLDTTLWCNHVLMFAAVLSVLTVRFRVRYQTLKNNSLWHLIEISHVTPCSGYWLGRVRFAELTANVPVSCGVTSLAQRASCGSGLRGALAVGVRGGTA